MKRSLPDARLRGRATCKWIGTMSMTWGLLLSVMVIGCAGSLDPGVGTGGTGGGSGSTCQVAIFRDQCAGCHAAGSGAAGLDLASPNPEQRLLNKMGGASGMCASMTLLVPNTNPAQGVFVDKVTMPTPPCGQSMPQGTLPSMADQTCLKDWATSVTMAASP